MQVNREEVENIFLSWQEGLPDEIIDRVDYDHYDASLMLVFIQRVPDVEGKHLTLLEDELRSYCPKIRLALLKRVA